MQQSLHNRLDHVEEAICELEDKSFEIIQSEIKKKKKKSGTVSESLEILLPSSCH